MIKACHPLNRCSELNIIQDNWVQPKVSHDSSVHHNLHRPFNDWWAGLYSQGTDAHVPVHALSNENLPKVHQHIALGEGDKLFAQLGKMNAKIVAGFNRRVAAMGRRLRVVDGLNKQVEEYHGYTRPS